MCIQVCWGPCLDGSWSSPASGPPVEKQGVEPGLSSSSHTWGVRAACSIPGARPPPECQGWTNPMPDEGLHSGPVWGQIGSRAYWDLAGGARVPPSPFLSLHRPCPWSKRPFLCFRLPAPGCSGREVQLFSELESCAHAPPGVILVPLLSTRSTVSLTQ